MAESSEESTFAPSRSPTPSTSERSTGRPRRSPVWEYFVFNDESGKSACQVELESKNSVCGHEVTGKFPTNLKQHLKESTTPRNIMVF